MPKTSEQKSSLLYKHYLNRGETRLNREVFEEAYKSSFIVRPDQLWTYSDLIPVGTPETGGEEALNTIKNLTNTEPYTVQLSESDKFHPIVKKWVNVLLTPVDGGTNTSFILKDTDGNVIQNIIPFNYYEEYYNYKLTLNDGSTVIPFGVGDWLLDCYSGILTFYGDVPEEVTNSNPPRISFYQYVGGNGFRQDPVGLEAAILPIEEVTIDADECVIPGTKFFDKINSKVNLITENYLKDYGIDGDDKHEGLALPLQKVIPLVYHSTKDKVKGYDKSINSEIVTLLSGIKPVGAPFILFASQGLANKSFDYSYGDNILAIDGEVYDLTAGINKVKIGNEFIIVNNSELDSLTGTVEFQYNISEEDVISPENYTCALLYWDSSECEYLPWVNNETSDYDFGFVIVSEIGLIPPSLKISDLVTSAFSDTITPDYYGPRNFTYTIATEDSPNAKSSDFIVRNRDGFYLSDFLKKVDTSKISSIFLRDGNYVINEDVSLNEIRLIGESRKVSIESINGHKITIANSSLTELSYLTINCNIEIEDVAETTGSLVFFSNIKANVSAKLIESSRLNVIDSSIGSISLEKKGESDSTEIKTIISNSNIGSLLCFDDNTIIKNNNIGTLTCRQEFKNIYIKSNTINKLSGVSADNLPYLDDNTVFDYDGDSTYISKEYDSVEFTSSSNEAIKFNSVGKLPFFDKDDFTHTRYANLAQPFVYNLTNNIIELAYDSDVLSIVNGELTTNINSDRIIIKDTFEKPATSKHSDSDSQAVDYNPTTDGDTLTKVLEHLFKNKAELDSAGKLYLQQLPEAVSYGGLMYVGNWSFEDNNGNYPTYSDVNAALSADDGRKGLQKGWFFIIQESKDSSDEDTDNDTPVLEQTAIDGEVFTAGDWLIYQGPADADGETFNTTNKFGEYDYKAWVKIDRAFSDPTYSPLPAIAKVPNKENKAWWWKDVVNGGALDLSNNTIIEAFNKINEYIMKLTSDMPRSIANAEFNLMSDHESFTCKDSNGSIKEVLFKSAEDIVYSTDKNDLIFFGDEAKISVKFDNETIGPVRVTANDSEVELFKDDDFTVIVHVENKDKFWKGLWFEIIAKPVAPTCKKAISIAMSDILTNDHNVYVSYQGSTKILNFDCYDYINGPITDNKYVVVDSSNMNIQGSSSNYCSGKALLSSITISNIDLKYLYNPDYLPLREQLTFKLMFGQKVVATKVIDTITLNEDNGYTIDGNGISVFFDKEIDTAYNLNELSLIVETNRFLDHWSYIAGTITVDSKYRIDYSASEDLNFHFINETERFNPGNIDEKTNVLSSWNPESALAEVDLIKEGTFYGDSRYELYKVQEGKESGVACFYLGKVEYAAGLNLKINVPEENKDKWIKNTLTNATKGLTLQVCVKSTLEENSLNWIDCNTPNDGFTIPSTEDGFGAAMVAARSSTLEKRVTFGRNITYSGDVYVRIKIDSGLEFESISCEAI